MIIDLYDFLWYYIGVIKKGEIIMIIKNVNKRETYNRNPLDLDFEKMDLDELYKINCFQLSFDELEAMNKRIDEIRERFDWYLENGGVKCMIDDGVDVKQFRIDYKRIEDITYDIYYAQKIIVDNKRAELHKNDDKELSL